MTTPLEPELAFTFPSLRRVNDHPLLRDLVQTSDRLVSTYFDTPDQLLEKSSHTVRIRQTLDGRQFQTVKGPRVGVNVPEWEIQLDTVIPPPQNLTAHCLTLDVPHLQSTPIAALLGDDLSALQPIFQTSIVRTIRLFIVGDTAIEIALDQGEIRTLNDDARRTIADLELEKKTGDIAVLFQVALALTLDAGLVLQPSSKAERGYQMIGAGRPKSVKHGDIVLADEPAIDGFRTIAIDCLGHLRQNLEAAKSGDAGGIHQVRVALRRTRAALRLFRRLCDQTTIEIYDRELQYFGRVFGQARDWDVFLSETLGKVPPSASVDLLRHVAEQFQNDSHEAVATEIASVGFNSLFLGLLAWAENPLLWRSTEWNANITHILPSLLTATLSKLLHRQANLDHRQETLHAFRKAVKNMRYAVEFVESLYSKKKVKHLLGPMKSLQEKLGVWNDVATTRELLEIIVEKYPAVAYASADFSARLNGAQSALPDIPRLHAFWK